MYTSISFFFLAEFCNPGFFLASIMGNIFAWKKGENKEKISQIVHILVKYLDLILSKQLIQLKNYSPC